MSDCVEILKSLADPTRLRIVNLLAQRELCVCQLCEVLGLGQSKISRHLAHLKHAGLVAGRRDGQWVYYRLARPTGRLHQRLARWLREAADEIPEGRADLEAMHHLAECGKLCLEPVTTGSAVLR